MFREICCDIDIICRELVTPGMMNIERSAQVLKRLKWTRASDPRIAAKERAKP